MKKFLSIVSQFVSQVLNLASAVTHIVRAAAARSVHTASPSAADMPMAVNCRGKVDFPALLPRPDAFSPRFPDCTCPFMPECRPVPTAKGLPARHGKALAAARRATHNAAE